MSSRTIKLILAVIIGVPVALTALTFAGVLALRGGSSTDVAAPVQVDAQAEPIMLGDVNAEVMLSEPTNGATVPEQRDGTRSTQLETVKHLATASGPYSDYDLYVLDEVVTDIETDRETIEHCILAYEGTADNETDGGGMCSPDEFTEPQYLEFNSVTRGSIEVSLFYAAPGSQTMTIETKTGHVVSSNLVNGAGFVQYDSANGEPKWITLYDSEGLAIWFSQMS